MKPEAASPSFASNPVKAPLLAGILTFAVVLAVWGSLDQVAVWHDEAAYVLQARIFASLRWAAEARPLPEFFEQYHVLVTPVLAAKYHPGHSLTMAPGALLGLPGLIPALMSALTGALVFVLARRLATPGVAWLTWLLWLTTLDNLRFRASYMSQVTTSLMVLVAWWALLEWRTSGRPRWLALTAAAVGWGAVTRPFTMAALGAPIVIAVLVIGVRRRAFGQLAMGGAVGVLLLATLPLWHHGTLGEWTDSPRDLYTRQYMPYDRMGFGLDPTPPERAIPADMARFNATFLPAHTAHVPAALPRTLLARMRALGGDVWGRWRVILLPAALLGLVGLGSFGLFALGSAAALLLSHLAYEFDPRWTVYYLEILPVLAYVTARGLALAWRWVESDPRRWPRDAQTATRLRAGLITALVILCSWDVAQARFRAEGQRTEARRLRDAVAELGQRPSILFVRLGPNHLPDVGLILNEPNLDRAPVIIARDRGSENVQLARLFPNRIPYLLETFGGESGPEQWRFFPLRPTQQPL